MLPPRPISGHDVLLLCAPLAILSAQNESFSSRHLCTSSCDVFYGYVHAVQRMLSVVPVIELYQGKLSLFGSHCVLWTLMLYREGFGRVCAFILDIISHKMVEQIIAKRYFDINKLHTLCTEKWGPEGYKINVSEIAVKREHQTDFYSIAKRRLYFMFQRSLLKYVVSCVSSQDLLISIG